MGVVPVTTRSDDPFTVIGSRPEYPMVWPSKVMVPDWLPLGMLVTCPPAPFSTSVSKPPAPPSSRPLMLPPCWKVNVSRLPAEPWRLPKPVNRWPATVPASDPSIDQAVSADGPTIVLPLPVAEIVLAPV